MGAARVIQSSVVEARSYGVRADGATDDTTAWGRAFTAATTAGGGVVRAPIGTSVVTGISVPADVTLQGHGSASILKLKSAANADVVTLAGARAQVADLMITGNSAGQSAGFPAGVLIAADDCTARSVIVSDAYKYGILATDVNRPEIIGCVVTGSGYIGIYVHANAADVADPVVSGCRVDRSALPTTLSLGGIHVHGDAGFVVRRPRITDCHVALPANPTHDDVICIETWGATTSPVIVGNTLVGGAMGVSCNSSPSASVTGNTVTGPDLYGIEVVTSDSATVTGNTVIGLSAVWGIAVNGAALSSKAVSITGNTLIGVDYGVRSQGASQITVSGNTVSLTGTAGIYVAGAKYASVTGNVVDDPNLTTNNGVFFDGCTWLTCTGNTISGVDQNGVLVYATTAITIKAFVFANVIDISAGSAFATSLSGGAVLSSESMVWGNSDGASTLFNAASNVRMITKTGSPEGVNTAGVGSICVRTDGGAVTTLYIKESGASNTGWVAK